MKIDSHHHIWDLSFREHSWMVGDVIAGVVGFLKIDAQDAISHLNEYENLPGAKYLVGICCTSKRGL